MGLMLVIAAHESLCGPVTLTPFDVTEHSEIMSLYSLRRGIHQVRGALAHVDRKQLGAAALSGGEHGRLAHGNRRRRGLRRRNRDYIA
jgi:hypothetical protein